MRKNLPGRHVPKIDILMGVYNGEQFLSEAIQSILNQTFTDFSFTIIDNGSTDNTPAILERFSHQDSRIKLLECRKKGLAAALNVGLEATDSPFIARMDADDISTPARLQAQYDWISARPNLVALGTGVWIINENGKTVKTRKTLVGQDKIRKTLPTRNCLCHSSAVIRTATLKKIGGYREQFRTSQDYDLWLRLLAHGEIDNLRERYLRYRKHPGATLRSTNARQLANNSVSAALGYFMRKYHLEKYRDTIDPGNPADIAEDLANIYAAKPQAQDIAALNRHAIRFLNTLNSIEPGKLAQLAKTIRPNFDMLDRLKYWYYSISRS